MPLNDLARERLRQLKRGESLRSEPRTCPKCEFRSSRHFRRCPSCKTALAVTCRLCDGPLPKRRRSWCGEECVDAYMLATSRPYLRRRTFGRDKGFCGKCGMDTQAIRKRVNALERGEKRRQGLLVLKENGFNVPVAVWASCPALWDADHIDAVNEGGGWELANVQTLCHPCHKEKTAEQAGRRAKQQRLLGKKWRPTEAMLRLSQGSA